MKNKGYSPGSNAGRIELSASGSYSAPYKLEPLMTGLIFGVFGTVALLILLFAVQYLKRNMKDDKSDMFLLMATSVVLIIIETLVIFTAMLLVKILRGGYKCTYISDGERFITNEGGNTRIIYFQDVQSVNFFSRTVFGKVRGYDVNVRLNGHDETYAVVSDGFISEKSTPFFLIVENVEKKRREQSRARYEEQLSKLGVLDLTASLQDRSVSPAAEEKPVSNQKSSAHNRLGQDVAMPALNLSAMAAVVSEQEKPSDDSNKNDSYIDENGREQLYSDIIGSGRFKVLCETKKTAALAAIAAAALGLSIFLYLKVLNEILFLIVGIAIAVVMVLIFLCGDECTYRANGREFVVTDKRGGETHIVYSDVQTVHYLNMLFGYKAEILTQYGIVSFKCLDKRNRIYQKPEKLPFNIIEKKIK